MRRGLQKNGRFALVAGVGAHAQQRRRCIEDTPDRRRFGGVQTLFDHLLEHFGIGHAFGYEPLGLFMLQQIKRPQGAVGNACRVLDGSRATW